MSENPVLIELFRRQALVVAVDAVIDERFEFGSASRIKRGRVHDAVSETLGLVLNNPLAILINERVKVRGGKAYISRGNLYFKGVSTKPERFSQPDWEW